MFVFLKLTLKIKVLNTYSPLELPRANGITLGQVFHLNCPHPFLNFVKGIIGVLNLTDHKINTTVVALIVLRDSMGTRVLKKLWCPLIVVR